MQVSSTSGMYYKPMTIINDNSRVVNKLEALLTDDAIVVIYDHHMLIVQATVGSMSHRYVLHLLFIENCKIINNSATTETREKISKYLESY